jgi:hypothetical protein
MADKGQRRSDERTATSKNGGWSFRDRKERRRSVAPPADVIEQVVKHAARVSGGDNVAPSKPRPKRS